MLPDSVLSTTPLGSTLLAPRAGPKVLLVEQAIAGDALFNGNSGLQSKLWTGRMVGNDVVFSAPGVSDTVILTKAGITELSIAFDTSMNPYVFYYANELCSLYWFDTVAGTFVTTNMPATSSKPRCALDDNRPLQTTACDVIISYIRGTSLYFRAQRERFLIEHLLKTGLPGVYDQCGMSRTNRFEFRFLP